MDGNGFPRREGPRDHPHRTSTRQVTGTKRRRSYDDDDTEPEDPDIARPPRSEPSFVFGANGVPVSPPRRGREVWSPDPNHSIHHNNTRLAREADAAKMERYAAGHIPGRDSAEVRHNRALFEMVCTSQRRNILNVQTLTSQIEANTRGLMDQAWRNCYEANDIIRSSLK